MIGPHEPMSKTPEMYLISVAADLLDMHPQTLRKYERLGLVRPLRTLGSMRVYTRDELDRLRLIKSLVDEEGINLAGVQRLLTLADIARRVILVVLFDNRTTLGLVKLRVRGVVESLSALFIAMFARESAGERRVETGFVGEAEDEIDKLFGN